MSVTDTDFVFTSIVPARKFERDVDPGFLAWFLWTGILAGDGTGGGWFQTFVAPPATMRRWAWKWGGLWMRDSAAVQRAVAIELTVGIVGGIGPIFAVGGQFNAGAGIPTFGGFPGNFPGSNAFDGMPPFIQPPFYNILIETSNPGVGENIEVTHWMKQYDPREN